jgi:tRNA G18 (ribose-2'-O)-methylase SpoU
VAIMTLPAAGDARIAEYASVADPDLARSLGLFVAEGRLVVRRLIDDSRYGIRSILLSQAAQQQLGSALERLDPRVPVYVCPIESFREITGFHIHRGCVAIVERPPECDAAALLHKARLVVMLEAIANPDNVGGIFRNAAAFGVDGAILDGASADPLYRKAIRTSMGAVLRVPYARARWPEVLPAVRASGLTIVALTPHESAEALDRFVERQRPPRVALLLGNEGAGLSDAAAASADVRVRIPMRTDVDSLNVAVAAGIALARLTRFADVG